MTEKNAWFTIDDSPSQTMTEKVDALYERNIPAIFFSIGKEMERFPEQIIYAIKKGFVIANHSWSHISFSDLSIQQCIEEIDKTEQLIEELYHKAGVQRSLKLFRYPFGNKGNVRYMSLLMFAKILDKKYRYINNHLKEKDYDKVMINAPVKRFPERLMFGGQDIYWTLDIKEWELWSSGKDYSFVEQRMEHHLSYNRGNEIILVHDHIESHTTFTRILDTLLDKEFKFSLPEK